MLLRAMGLILTLAFGLAPLEAHAKVPRVVTKQIEAAGGWASRSRNPSSSARTT